MQIDTERWRRLRDAAADAADSGPTFVQVQEANGRWVRARDELARLKAAGATGRASRPVARARAGEEIAFGIGGHDQAGVERAFEGSVHELEVRTAEAEAVAKRMSARLREAGERRATLQRLVDEVRRWAAAQQPPVLLPGDSSIEMPAVTVAGPRPGSSRDFMTGRIV